MVSRSSSPGFTVDESDSGLVDAKQQLLEETYRRLVFLIPEKDIKRHCSLEKLDYLLFTTRGEPFCPRNLLKEGDLLFSRPTIDEH